MVQGSPGKRDGCPVGDKGRESSTSVYIVEHACAIMWRPET